MKSSIFVFILAFSVAVIGADFFHEASSEFQSFGKLFPGRETYTWTITSDPGATLYIKFLIFNTNQDQVVVTDSDDNELFRSGGCKGYGSIDVITTVAESVTVTYSVSSGRRGLGFRAVFYQVGEGGVDLSCKNNGDCGMNARCSGRGGEKQCVCDDGYEGNAVTGCTNVNECHRWNRCHHAAECTDTPGSYECSCKNGFTGNGRWCADVNECRADRERDDDDDDDDSDHDDDDDDHRRGRRGRRGRGRGLLGSGHGGESAVCGEHARCRNTYGSYLCYCRNGFVMRDNECVESDECYHELTASSAAALFNSNGGLRFYKNNMDCTWNITAEPGSTISLKFKYFLTERGYDYAKITDASGPLAVLHGIYLRLPVFTTSHGWMAVRFRTDFSRVFFGFLAEYSAEGGNCDPSCGANSDCQLTATGYQCVCRDGYTLDGDACVDIDECSVSSDACGANSTCENTDGSFECFCKEGYDEVGGVCVDVDECAFDPQPCPTPCTCENNAGSFQCTCPAGYRTLPLGDDPAAVECEDVDECANPEESCPDPNDECSNLTPGFECICNPGFERTVAGGGCADIDECTESPNICGVHATCENIAGGYHCSCIGESVKITEGDAQSGCTPCSAILECGPLEVTDIPEGSDTCQCVCQEGTAFDDAVGACVCVTGPLNEETGECMEDFCTMCDSNAECLDGSSMPPVCRCNPGFVAEVDGSCSNVNECTSETDECDANADCTDTFGSYSCACRTGYESVDGGRTCIDINDCIGASCPAESVCEDLLNGYNCVCNPGYAGEDCTNENGCLGVDCGPGSCVDAAPPATGFTCDCDDGYFFEASSGTCANVDECAANPCDANAACADSVGSFTCTCTSGYSNTGSGDSGGVVCTDADACSAGPSPCGSVDVGAVCNDEAPPSTSYTCTCSEGFAGTTTCADVDECVVGDEEACGPLMECTNTVGSFACSCVEGYEDNGAGVCIDVNECESSSPPECREFSTCVNTIGSYHCPCNIGYVLSGDVCQDRDECNELPYPCAADATCSNVPAGSFSCTCNSGFTGDGHTCTDLNECDLFTDDCSPDATCDNTPGSFTCDCNAGYTGGGHGVDGCINIDECSAPGTPCTGNRRCQDTIGSFVCIDCPAGFEVNASNNEVCDNVNECASGLHNCGDQGGVSCLDTEGSFVCSCPSACFSFVADVGCVNIDDCSGVSCGGNGECQDKDCTHECVCAPGYANVDGDILNACENVNECLGDPCDASATCTDTDGSFECECNPGFVGDGLSCINEDNCNPDPCNGYPCVDGVNSYVCECPEGYDSNCLDIDECLSGHACDLNAVCTNTIGSYSCMCADGFSGDGLTCGDINECTCDGVEPCANPCGGNGAICDNTIGSFDCSCPEGATYDPDTGCPEIIVIDPAQPVTFSKTGNYNPAGGQTILGNLRGPNGNHDLFTFPGRTGNSFAVPFDVVFPNEHTSLAGNVNSPHPREGQFTFDPLTGNVQLVYGGILPYGTATVTYAAVNSAGDQAGAASTITFEIVDPSNLPPAKVSYIGDLAWESYNGIFAISDEGDGVGGFQYPEILTSAHLLGSSIQLAVSDNNIDDYLQAYILKVEAELVGGGTCCDYFGDGRPGAPANDCGAAVTCDPQPEGGIFFNAAPDDGLYVTVSPVCDQEEFAGTRQFQAARKPWCTDKRSPTWRDTLYTEAARPLSNEALFALPSARGVAEKVQTVTITYAVFDGTDTSTFPEFHDVAAHVSAVSAGSAVGGVEDKAQEEEKAKHDEKMTTIVATAGSLGTVFVLIAIVLAVVFVVRGGCKKDNDVDRTGYLPADEDNEHGDLTV